MTAAILTVAAGWRLAVASLRRPYRVTLPMVALVLLVPLYLFIPQLASDRTLWSRAVPLDALIALQPAWVLIYGPLYLFLILLPLFVVRLASYRVHRRVGIVALICALLVGISTLFTKQHYVLDVAAGILLAGAAGAVFLRGVRREEVSEADRRAAPALALAVAALVAAMMGVYFSLYLLGVR